MSLGRPRCGKTARRVLRKGGGALRDGRGAPRGDDRQGMVARDAGRSREPKFLRDMREENEGQGEAMIAAAPDMLKALRTIEFDVRGRCTACFGWDGSSENDHKHANDCIVASAIAKATGT